MEGQQVGEPFITKECIKFYGNCYGIKCLAFDKQNKRILVTDYENYCVQVFDLKTKKFISKFDNKIPNTNFWPYGITIIQQKIFVVNRVCHTIHAFSLESYRLLYSFGTCGEGPCEFAYPSYITSSSNWNGQDLLFVSDDNNHRVQVLDLNGSFITQINGDSYFYEVAVGSNYVYACRDNFVYVYK
jgi:WD40 repeat protein